MKLLYKISILLSVLFAFRVQAQDKLGTISVDIVKPYTPTIADVQKPTEQTPKKDTIAVAKKQVTYSSQSVPVTSTFVPEKGKAARIPVVSKRDSLYHSYIALAGGNYSSLYGDAFLSLPLSATSDLSVDFSHHSSQSNVKAADTDSNFAHTQAQATYSQWAEAYQYHVSANVLHRLSHWYGVEQKALLPIAASLKQNYLSGGISGDLKLTKGVFEGLDFFLQGAKDDFDSGELQFNLCPSLRFALKEGQLIQLKGVVDYLQGRFDRAFAAPVELVYKSAFLGLRPAYVRTAPNYSVRIGLGAYYAKQNDGEGGKFKLFPDVELSYNAIKKSLIAYGGITGNLQQLTYREQSLENPYLSPTQYLQPTYTPYDIYAGIRGALFQGFAYDLKGFYSHIIAMPMFQANAQYTLADRKPYHYDNSYHLIYQDGMSFGAKASIRGKLSDRFHIDASAKVNSYFFDWLREQEWNLPIFTSALSARYRILPAWNIGTSFYWVGARKDIKHTLPTSPTEEVTLDGFFDLNFSTDYTFLKRWTAFADLSNITGAHYQRWTNYPVQGFQVLVGAKYRFNIR